MMQPKVSQGFALLVLVSLIIVAAPLARSQSYQEGWWAYNARDFKGAYEIWRPLANRGDNQAQLMIGLLYANGKGVPQNWEEAYKWFLIADANGNRQASALYEGATRLDKLMTAEERARAERAAREWRPKDNR